MEIQNLNQYVNQNTGIDWHTMPKVIKDEYIKNGHRRAETHTRNSDGKMEVTYGDLLPPSFTHYCYGGISFYVNMKYCDDFYNFIDSNQCYDVDLNIITRKNLKPYLAEYSKGFNKGYFEYENNLKNDDPLFGSSNQQIAHKVYSRVMTHKRGDFPVYVSAEENELELKIRKELGVKSLFKVYKDSFEIEGCNGGEFYKAWEIILCNPTIFEPIFAKNTKEKEPEPEPEPLDLPKTSAVEKPFFINEFDTVQESKIIEYFTKNLVDKKYISVEVLNNYLKQAFELKTAPKQKFSFENINTKENIVSIFYKYYKETAAKPHGKQQMYLDLLKIYFSGFEKINIRNFSK